MQVLSRPAAVIQSPPQGSLSKREGSVIRTPLLSRGDEEVHAKRASLTDVVPVYLGHILPSNLSCETGAGSTASSCGLGTIRPSKRVRCPSWFNTGYPCLPPLAMPGCTRYDPMVRCVGMLDNPVMRDSLNPRSYEFAQLYASLSVSVYAEVVPRFARWALVSEGPARPNWYRIIRSHLPISISRWIVSQGIKDPWRVWHPDPRGPLRVARAPLELEHQAYVNLWAAKQTRADLLPSKSKVHVQHGKSHSLSETSWWRRTGTTSGNPLVQLAKT